MTAPDPIPFGFADRPEVVETVRVPKATVAADYLLRVQCLIECCALDPPMNVEADALRQLHGETLDALAAF